MVWVRAWTRKRIFVRNASKRIYRIFGIFVLALHTSTCMYNYPLKLVIVGFLCTIHTSIIIPYLQVLASWLVCTGELLVKPLLDNIINSIDSRHQWTYTQVKYTVHKPLCTQIKTKDSHESSHWFTATNPINAHTVTLRLNGTKQQLSYVVTDSSLINAHH